MTLVSAQGLGICMGQATAANCFPLQVLTSDPHISPRFCHQMLDEREAQKEHQEMAQHQHRLYSAC
jgi:hypothetical protein